MKAGTKDDRVLLQAGETGGSVCELPVRPVVRNRWQTGSIGRNGSSPPGDQNMSNLELISSDVCPFAQRSRIALLEKNLDFDTTKLEYVGDSFDKPQWFLDLTPSSRVPVLKHDGNVVYESEVVNEYLEEVYPEPPLLPRDPGRRALCRIWISYSNGMFLQGFYHLIMSLEPQAQECYKAEFAERLLFMEREGIARLSDDGPYWMGEEVSLVDLSFYPFFERFTVLEHYRGFSLPGECRRLKAWLEAMQKRPSVRQTRESDDFHNDVYKNYAVGKQRGLTSQEMAATME